MVMWLCSYGASSEFPFGISVVSGTKGPSVSGL